MGHRLSILTAGWEFLLLLAQEGTFKTSEGNSPFNLTAHRAHSQHPICTPRDLGRRAEVPAYTMP